MLVTPAASRGCGWRQDVRDFRDHTAATPVVGDQLAQLALPPDAGALPSRVDWREYLPPVDDQRTIQSSPAHACLSMAEYFHFRTLGSRGHASRMFVYYTSRRLMHLKGDSGADLRSTLKAMKRFGAPPSEYWPYEADRVEATPDAFLYLFENPFQNLTYFRLDRRNSTGADTLHSLKSFLAAGFTVAFGFPVPSSLGDGGEIPYRPAFDSVRGGHAVLAVGYDDRWLGATRGAVLVRNSWGTGWGENGYGWLPYRFVEEQLAIDFWTMLTPEIPASSDLTRPMC